MRAYIKNSDSNFQYPEDMQLILAHLRRNGHLNISDEMVESFYEGFSESVYCAGWMCVDDQILEEFSSWLADKEA